MTESAKFVVLQCPTCKGYFVNYNITENETICRKCKIKPVFYAGKKNNIDKSSETKNNFGISEENKQILLNLFQNKVESGFLSYFLENSKKLFNEKKWQINCNEKDIENFFTKEYEPNYDKNNNNFTLAIINKLKITLFANPSTTKTIAKFYLILSLIWLKTINNEIDINVTLTDKIKKTLTYFIDIDDFVPDTSQGGYLDDLYIFILAFKRIRKDKIQEIINELMDVYRE